MTGSGIIGAVWLVLAPAPAEAAPPVDAPSVAAPTTDVPPPEQGPRPLVVAVTGTLSTAELRGALSLRLPDRPLLPAEAPRPTTTDFVEITAADDGTLAFTLITAEGLAYDRTLAAEPGGDSVRAVAATIANLTFAIEAGTIQPDRVDVPQPPPPEPAPAPEPEPEPAPEPVVVAPKPAAPKPAPKPDEPPPWELAPTIDGGVVIGVAPSAGGDALGAGYARIGVDARRREGALVTAGLRFGARSTHGLSLLRVRIDLGGGWAWRWKHAELVLAGAVTVEPWALSEGGSRATLMLGTTSASRRPLLGGLVRVSPAVRIRLRKERPLYLRLGPKVELAGSFVPQDGARTVDIAREDRERVRSVMRLGGLELVAGLELAIWFPVGGR